MTPEQYGLWLRLFYGPAVVMNPMLAFWLNAITIKAEPPRHPPVKRVVKK